ncbi:hypothetical protein BCV69DRAFT_300782 [Microstroma glucosiphilum]|uniref:Uncharacterized protein n=1 Tax=Pseudomicrostroma glucosiphilum TaxID=1684307 RepID=A0A316U0S0_9BASI|nr:hypothetical protein BCV69DRAFT_300782 [Pseudomicrostroma glucosiphilum]PWN18996.1 hypothetical protein BCV69DRAFT_300782 [Pseudomicrostroma glucosiphilum]
MPDSPPSPSHVVLVRQNRTRTGSSLPARPSSRLGKRSSPPRDDGCTPARTEATEHSTFLPVPFSSAMGTSRAATVEQRIAARPASRLTAGAAIEAAHKRYRSSSQMAFSRPSQGDAMDPSTRRAVSGIPPPSSYAERPLQRAPGQASSLGRPTASAVSSASITRTQNEASAAPARIQQKHLRRPSLQPLTHQRQATVRSVSSNILPPSKPDFTFRSRLSVQPLEGNAKSDTLAGPRPLSSAHAHAPHNDASIRSHFTRVGVDQTPSKRDAYVSGKTERLSAVASASTKRKVLDTPAARERGYRRLGHLMLLPGRRSMSNSGADFIVYHSEDTPGRFQSARGVESRGTTPTQRDFADKGPERFPTVPCRSTTGPEHDFIPPTKGASKVPLPDQTCMTLAALSVNEDTLLVSDDAILADLRAEASRVDIVDDGRHDGASARPPPTTGPSLPCCYQIRPSEGSGQALVAEPSGGSDIRYIREHESDAHLAILELRERVDELTRALQEERLSHAADVAHLQAAEREVVEEVRKKQEQVNETAKARRRQEAEAESRLETQVKSWERTAGRALVAGAVAGYEGLMKAAAVELDVVKSEREMCLLLLRNLKLCSSTLM